MTPTSRADSSPSSAGIPRGVRERLRRGRPPGLSPAARPDTLGAMANDTTSHPADIGLIGLAVMGQNLVLNLADRGHTVAVYNRTTTVTDAFLAGEAADKEIFGHTEL